MKLMSHAVGISFDLPVCWLFWNPENIFEGKVQIFCKILETQANFEE